MDNEAYENQVAEMLSDTQIYTKLGGDSTPKYNRKFVSILIRLKQEKRLTDHEYKFFYPMTENIPSI